MHLLLRLVADAEASAALAAEHAHWRGVLTARAEALSAALVAAGCAPAPWDGGFFVTLPARDPEAVAAALRARDIYVIPMAEGLRVGICGMRAADAERFATGYAEAVRMTA
jgi:hypothetical protein